MRTRRPIQSAKKTNQEGKKPEFDGKGLRYLKVTKYAPSDNGSDDYPPCRSKKVKKAEQ